MQRKIRRNERIMDNDKAVEVLKSAEYGTLATAGEDNMPYAVPLSFVFYNDYIFFHCAHSGHKTDNMAFQNSVCFNVVGHTRPVYDKGFTTYYQSVTVFGKASEVIDEKEKKQALAKLCEKYLPEHMSSAADEIERYMKATAVYKITADSITAKANSPV